VWTVVLKLLEWLVQFLPKRKAHTKAVQSAVEQLRSGDRHYQIAMACNSVRHNAPEISRVVYLSVETEKPSPGQLQSQFTKTHYRVVFQWDEAAPLPFISSQVKGDYTAIAQAVLAGQDLVVVTSELQGQHRLQAYYESAGVAASYVKSIWVSEDRTRAHYMSFHFPVGLDLEKPWEEARVRNAIEDCSAHIAKLQDLINDFNEDEK